MENEVRSLAGAERGSPCDPVLDRAGYVGREKGDETTG
jgi:hypothetical protein